MTDEIADQAPLVETPAVETGRVTARQAMDLAAQAQEDAGQAAEAASMAIQITGELDVKIADLGRQIAAGTTDRQAAAILLKGVREDVAQLKKGGPVAADLDGIRARLEKIEQDTKGATYDWGPSIADLATAIEKLRGEPASGPAERNELATRDDLTALGEVVDQRVDEVVRGLQDLANKYIALSGQPGGLDEQAFDVAFNHRLNRLVEHRAVFEQELLTRLQALEELNWGRAASGGGNGVQRKILALMNAVEAIGKDKEVRPEDGRKGPTYAFRGIDQAMDAVGVAMRKVALILRTQVVKSEVFRNEVTKNGYTQVWTSVFLTMRYVFVDPDDSSEFPFEMVGEGKDVSDKAASKAASMACKYGLFQALMIPVKGLNESDGHNPTEDGDPPAATQAARPAAPANRLAPESSTIEKARAMAEFIRKAQGQPADQALSALRNAKTSLEKHGLMDYDLDNSGVTLGAVLNTALQTVNAAIANKGNATTQGVTRAEQVNGGGTRAAADPTTGPDTTSAPSPKTSESPTTGSPTGITDPEQERKYLKALDILADQSQPQENVNWATYILNTTHQEYPELRERFRARAQAVMNAASSELGDDPWTP